MNFVLNNLLIPRWYSVGAALSSVTAETVIAVIQIIIVRKEINPIKIIMCSGKYWIAGMGMLFFLFYIGRYLISSVANTAVMICAGALFYAMILLALRDSFFLSQIKNILSKVRGRIGLEREK